MNLLPDILRGLWRKNPTFRLLLGMCPTLAVTTSLENALGLGAATCFVLVCGNAVISLFRDIIPNDVRIPCYILLIASFNTLVEMLMYAYTPMLAENLGIYIPLIAVNCIILGRAEAFAAKNRVLPSMADGLGMGLGFTLALVIVAVCREAVGNGTLTLWGDRSLSLHNNGLILAILPPGGFIALGAIIAGINAFQNYLASRSGKEPPRPVAFDCRQCVGCNLFKP